jgi:hypothetical protein
VRDNVVDHRGNGDDALLGAHDALRVSCEVGLAGLVPSACVATRAS